MAAHFCRATNQKGTAIHDDSIEKSYRYRISSAPYTSCLWRDEEKAQVHVEKIKSNPNIHFGQFLSSPGGMPTNLPGSSKNSTRTMVTSLFRIFLNAESGKNRGSSWLAGWYVSIRLTKWLAYVTLEKEFVIRKENLEMWRTLMR